MDWTTHNSPIGFSLDHPAGWVVESAPASATVVRSPDGVTFALIQPMFEMGGKRGMDVIQKGMFPTALLFPAAQPEDVQEYPNGAIGGSLLYRCSNGLPGRAVMTYIPSGDTGMLYASAAPESQIAQIQPTLQRILQSLRQTGSPAPQSPSQPPSSSPPPLPRIAYTRLIDPQMGTFSLELPQGWQTRAGLAHPQPGDRRAWAEAMSSDGIMVAFGDPSFPQSLVHFPGQGEGQVVPLAAGGQFLNLKPSADRALDYYLKNIAPGRLGAFQPAQRRPRPDLVQLTVDYCHKTAIPLTRSTQITATESILQMNFNGQLRIASVLATGFFTGDYVMGMWAFWNALVYLYVAPPQLVDRAEQIRMHMIRSYEMTPRMQQLYQQDEAIIAANGQAANAAQWNWFAGQQSVHRAQTAMGDAIVSNYWQQQSVNDSIVKSWEHNQAVNDRLSQDRSDAMMDRQRLADDGEGKQYDVAAGHNYYWRDQQTGNIIGTDTDTPPDYTNNYTQLRRL